MSFLFGGGAKDTHTSENKLSGVRIQTSSQGVPISIVYGATRVTVNLLWYGDFTSIAHTTSQEVGGKGGGGSTATNTSYTYTTGGILGVCEGPITSFGTIWESKNITNTTELGFTEFLGTYTQNEWTYMTTNHPTQAFKYRGTAYLASGAINLGNSDSLPNYSVEVNGIPTYHDYASVWTGRIGTDNGNFLCVAWNGVLFAAVAYQGGAANQVMTSPDGITWTKRSSATNEAWRSVSASGSLFAAVATTSVFATGNQIMTSPDGVSWTIRTTPAPANTNFYGIVGMNSLLTATRFVAVASNNSNGNRAMSSNDGITWSMRATPANNDWKAVCWGGQLLAQLFVAVADSGTGNRVMTSPDGITWTIRTSAADNDWKAVCWSDTLALFAAVASSGVGNRVMTSPDGINWTSRTSAADKHWNGIAWNGTVFAAVCDGDGSFHQVMTSNDGINWALAATPYNNTWAGIAYGAGVFCAVSTVVAGITTSVMTGTDGNTTSPGSAFDVNPAAVMIDILTSEHYGAGFPLTQLDSLGNFSTYCNNSNIFISPAYTAQTSAADIVTELAMIGNTAPVWSEGLLKMIPYADANIGTYVPNTTINYALTDDDFIADAGEEPIRVNRKRQADAYNQVQIEVLDRSNDYNNYVAESKDQWNIDVYGLRPMSMIACHAICQPQIGRDVSQRILQRALYIRNEYEFTLSWKYSRLEPMDLVSLTDSGLGLSATVVRITSVEEDDTGSLKMLAEDFLGGGLTAGAYSSQTGNGTIINTNISSGNAVTPVIFQPPIALTSTPQIWLGSAGGANWGGAQIWASNDGATYSMKGTITSPARFGTLTANLPAVLDPDTTSTLSVDLTTSLGALLTVPQAQADALATLSYIDGEIGAYATANLTSAYNYNITYLRRGQEGSTPNAHLTGTKFMRLDNSVVHFDIDSTWVATTIYIKLLSYNTTGGALQTLADVTPTSYVVQKVGMSTTTGVPSLIPAGQYLYIASGVQMNVARRITIYGRLQDFGRLIVN